MSENPGAFLLPLILALPVIGAIFVMCTPKTEAPLHRGIGFAFSLITLAISLMILGYFRPNEGGFQLVFDVEWIPGLGAHFKTGYAARRSATFASRLTSMTRRHSSSASASIR